MASITLAIVYRPENGCMPIILSQIPDTAMLQNAMRTAAAAAESKATAGADGPVSRGRREEARILRHLLAQLDRTTLQ